MTLAFRTHVAKSATAALNALSRRLGLGNGTVIGGQVGLLIDPSLLAHLCATRRVALVTGTNGKTTTTRLLVAALSGDVGPRTRPLTNSTGANMPAGHVAALVHGPRDAPAVLEVDEGYLPHLLDACRPDVVVLLNLSRDQLDRTNEVRMLAGRWREALGSCVGTALVANADDPLVVWGAGSAANVTWIAAGMRWRHDALGCPACDGRITWPSDKETEWFCACGFRRPTASVQVQVRYDEHGTIAEWREGIRQRITLQIPGKFNASNAVMAAVAAKAWGTEPPLAFERMRLVENVAGRFSVRQVEGVPTRLLLAKNPAGWSELLDLVASERKPVVLGINARIADGKDPSWLWDVPFEVLQGRTVVATGERCRDLAVRLRHAEVPHATVPEPASAIRLACSTASFSAEDGERSADPSRGVDFIGNYTAFSDLWNRR